MSERSLQQAASSGSDRSLLLKQLRLHGCLIEVATGRKAAPSKEVPVAAFLTLFS